MKMNKSYVLWAAVSLVGGSALAQTRTANDQARDVNQEQRIEQGLKSGALSTQEAGKLEHEEARVDHMEAKDLRNGSISASEQARLNAAQNKVSRDIHAKKTNAVTGNPNSASSERMQADVQRNVNQQKRIENGVNSGALTNREVGHLERGQSHVDAREAHAARNGHVSAREQAKVQGSENFQSAKIYRKKHNGRVRG